MAWKLFKNNTALTQEDLNDVLMEQCVITFADAPARDAAIPAPNIGMHCFLVSTGATYKYVSGSWIELLGATVSGLTARQTLVCTSTTRPAHAAGRFIYETETKRTYVSDGAAWIYTGGGIPAVAAFPYNVTNGQNFGSTFAPVTYWKDASGMVRMQGLAQCKVAISHTSGASVGTLPAGFRPGFTVTNATMITETGVNRIARLDIDVNGDVRLVNDSGVNWAANGFFQVNTVSYLAVA